MTCKFCRRPINNPGFVRYLAWVLHEPCWHKLRAVARATGGVL